jgi:hypothetical protein
MTATWISPDGQIVYAKGGDHALAARTVFPDSIDAELEMENSGWMKSGERIGCGPYTEGPYSESVGNHRTEAQELSIEKLWAEHYRRKAEEGR